MHILTAQPGVEPPQDQAVDLGHDPADIIFISAADTDLSIIAEANKQNQNSLVQKPSLQLANISQLQHPYSVDLYIEKTLAKSSLVVIRILGGADYWKYGVEEVSRLAKSGMFKLALLPGCASEDDTLINYSSVDIEDCKNLWQYFVEGGSDNAANFLKYCDFLLAEKTIANPPPAKKTPRAGFLDLSHINQANDPNAKALIVFYRAMVQAKQCEPIFSLAEQLQKRGINAQGVYVASLKEKHCVDFIRSHFCDNPPDIIINSTAFALSTNPDEPTILDEFGVPVIQGIVVSSTQEIWQKSVQGLPGRDHAMQIALPEVDGRIITKPFAFKEPVTDDASQGYAAVKYTSKMDRINWLADYAFNWIKLAKTPKNHRKIAIVLSNYPGDAGSIGTAVGLDTPNSVVGILKTLSENGYELANSSNIPTTSSQLINRLLLSHPEDDNSYGSDEKFSNFANVLDHSYINESCYLSAKEYLNFFGELPAIKQKEVIDAWGEYTQDKTYSEINSCFIINAIQLGNISVAVQPPRVWVGDKKSAHHDNNIVPHHGYLAFYAWLRAKFSADAIVQVGKHGSCEWLPGKAIGLSQECWPEVCLGSLPLIYPFIINDPGEGSQAKRRTSAVIISHLTPPIKRADMQGDLADLENMVDEYYQAVGSDLPRANWLLNAIIEKSSKIGLIEKNGVTDLSINNNSSDALNSHLNTIDNFLCDIKNLQIRGGLHVFGESWANDKIDQWLEALQDNNASSDLGAAKRLIEESASLETQALLQALDGKFIKPSASGAPSRGRLDVLPTGRNFYSVDPRAVPTRAAWELAKVSAEATVQHYVQQIGQWPRLFSITLWGTANMRTGGDDVAQALAFLGVQPVWDKASNRVTGVKPLPLSELGRPRVDIFCRSSGLFRDSFDRQISLITEAVAAVAVLHEPPDANPIAARVKSRLGQPLHSINNEQDYEQSHIADLEDFPLACMSVFSSRPGTYGSGIERLLDNDLWKSRDELAQCFTENGCFGYTSSFNAQQAKDIFCNNLANVDAIVQNLDNREFDLLDSGDYASFQGGMLAAAEYHGGNKPMGIVTDHSKTGSVAVRNLSDELALVVIGRVTNSGWINPTLDHGYKGVSEFYESLRNLINYAALTDVVNSSWFDRIFDAWILDNKVRDKMQQANPAAYKNIIKLFNLAVERNNWHPHRNSIAIYLNEAQ